jgi:hypothetical protein
MTRKSKQEYLKQLQKRYIAVCRKDKKAILDEAQIVTGYNRKYINRFLLSCTKKQRTQKRRGKKLIYDHAFAAALQEIWLACNKPCGELLKSMIPVWLPFMSTYSSQVTDKLLKVSIATIDRKLTPIRAHYGPKGITTTRVGSFLREHIPVSTTCWDEKRLGFFEVDTVAHCGETTEGTYMNTLTAVDIATGWTELRPLWNKTENTIKEAAQDIEKHLPFDLLGWDTDNGSELLNRTMYKHFSERPVPVQFTRCRPYKKNDQAHVEERNRHRVRQLVGYDRFDKQSLMPLLQDIYSDWCLLTNLFFPTFKLTGKQRNNATGKTRREYDDIRTPLQRVLASPDIAECTRLRLEDLYHSTNPVILKAQIDKKLDAFFKLLRLP